MAPLSFFFWPTPQALKMSMVTSSIGWPSSELMVTKASCAVVRLFDAGGVVFQFGAALSVDDAGEIADVALGFERFPVRRRPMPERADQQTRDEAEQTWHGHYLV